VFSYLIKNKFRTKGKKISFIAKCTKEVDNVRAKDIPDQNDKIIIDTNF
jgi:hypothetical protein